MRKFLLLGLLLLSTFAAPQAIPDAPSKVKGFVAGGFIYDARETDGGFWTEIGLLSPHEKFSGSVGYHEEFDSYWGDYRAIQPTGRYWVVPSFAVEGGYEFGYGCYNPVKLTSCDRWLVRWYTPFAGLAYRQKISKHLSGFARFDLTRSQLSARPASDSRGKDGGLRINIGLMVTP